MMFSIFVPRTSRFLRRFLCQSYETCLRLIIKRSLLQECVMKERVREALYVSIALNVDFQDTITTIYTIRSGRLRIYVYHVERHTTCRSASSKGLTQGQAEEVGHLGSTFSPKCHLSLPKLCGTINTTPQPLQSLTGSLSLLYTHQVHATSRNNSRRKQNR